MQYNQEEQKKTITAIGVLLATREMIDISCLEATIWPCCSRTLHGYYAGELVVLDTFSLT